MWHHEPPGTPEDDLATVKGIIIGLIFSSVIWLVIWWLLS